MFDSIRNVYSNHEMTGASYSDGEVIGSISFHASPERNSVLSSIGPDAAVRECSASHYYSSWLGRHKARTSEEVIGYL